MTKKGTVQQEKRKCDCVSAQWDKWYGPGIRSYEKCSVVPLPRLLEMTPGDETWKCLQCGKLASRKKK